jgi:D-beta-D-heptose 7-phosphate kinase / D-beta-D-heptose 1-phosphate adenosyltransferase
MRIGLTNGCFDLFHHGHKHFLMQASMRCEYLIVAVNSDESVRRLKGLTRPIDALHKRMHNTHKYADAVIPFEGRVDKLIMEIRPHVLFKGYDHTHTDFMAMRQIGWKDTGNWDRVEVVQISQLEGYSTTRLLNEAKSHASNGP